MLQQTETPGQGTPDYSLNILHKLKLIIYFAEARVCSD